MRRTKPLTGRMKSCASCGTEFYCPPSTDVGGTLPVRKYCTRKCYHAGIKYTPEQAEAAFWAKVDKNGPNGCWVWTGAKKRGYGAIGAGTKVIQAHRVSWELTHGPLPDGNPRDNCVLHHCDNRPCVNPEHLFVGTYKDNAADAQRKGRNHRSRLTAEDVRAIRVSTEPRPVLAKRYKVDTTAIWAAQTGRKWKHIV